MGKNSITRIYIDVCTLCRPFDDQNSMRIRLETDAYHLIVRYIIKETYTLMVSPIHFLEIQPIDDPKERYSILTFLNQHGARIIGNSSIVQRIDRLHSLGCGLGDAAHLAFAEIGSQVFITCDDQLIKRYIKADPRIQTMNPIQFCLHEELR